MGNERIIWRKVYSGKVREVYEQTADVPLYTMLVASDRVSAFDKVLKGAGVPGKGKVLTKMSTFWSKLLDRHPGDQCCTAFQRRMEQQVPNLEGFVGRSVVQDKLIMLPVEVIVREYITGSMWEAYKNGEREFCGIELPRGLKEGQQLPRPIMTPTTKAPQGQHDENISFKEMIEIISAITPRPEEVAEEVKTSAIIAFNRASEHLQQKGIILADTKFEFGIRVYTGMRDGELMFGDELLTPDSSRFWSAEKYEPGRTPDSLDKQIIRDYIREQKAAGVENPEIPEEIIAETAKRYAEICELVTGEKPDD